MRNEFGRLGGPLGSWNFFQKPEKDIEKLLDLYGNKNHSANFVTSEDALVSYLARKAIMQARWKQRLRFGRLVLAYFKRVLKSRWMMHGYPRWLQLKVKFTAVADKEEQLQRAETLPDEPAPIVQKFMQGAAEARLPGFPEGDK